MEAIAGFIDYSIIINHHILYLYQKPECWYIYCNLLAKLTPFFYYGLYISF